MEENEPIPVGSETLDPVCVEVREDASMLDVPSPHAAVHSWKDFWMHLVTITIGLLIAISLEQSVEWLHHLHQRHQLEEDLREEGLKNQEVVKPDIRYFDYGMATTAARLREVESELATRGRCEGIGGTQLSPAWRGYGHMGCCMLFVVTHVVSVPAHQTR